MSKRKPWNYDAFKGRPAWSKELGRQMAIQRQIEKDRQDRKDRKAA